jgi:hypothetical protein
MSKKPTTEGPAEDLHPAAAHLRLPIGQCVGRMVVCPQCNSPASVDHARGNKSAGQVISSPWYVLTRCQGHFGCGAALRKVDMVVEVLPEPIPAPKTETLGRSVGHRIICPRKGCSSPRASGAWSIELGHTVQCLECGETPYPGITMVELVRA